MFIHQVLWYSDTVYSGYSGHVYSGHSDIVATFPGKKYMYSIIFRSDMVANRIYIVMARKGWPKVATISDVHCINVKRLPNKCSVINVLPFQLQVTTREVPGEGKRREGKVVTATRRVFMNM